MAVKIKAGSGRLWVTQFGAGPTHTPQFVSEAMAGAPDWPQGDVTKIESPSDVRYNQWEQDAEFQQSQDRATVTLTRRLFDEFSVLAELRRLRCAFDAQLHMGVCGQDPRDFDAGWDKIYVYPYSYIASYKTTEQGAMEGSEEAASNEEVDISSRELYEIQKMNYSSVANNAVLEEVQAISICDNIDCGTCGGLGSNGRNKVFALTNPKTASPGLKPQVIATADGYTTPLQRFITTYALGEEASDGTCVGSYYVAVSSDGIAAHYAPLADILDQVETWTKVTTGFVAAKGPNAIWSYSSLMTIIVGNGGYIYKMEDPAAGVTVLDAGSATAQNLNDVEGFNARVIVAVGASNAVVYSPDGGATWASVTGPSPAVALNAVGLRTETEWWVGNASGAVYFTVDKGVHWTQVTGLKSTPTAVTKIRWTDKPGVGYIATTHAGPAGKIQRTISGGKTWYIVPETGSNIPANDAIYDIAVPDDEVNVLFAGGLADNAGDGIIIRGIHNIV